MFAGTSYSPTFERKHTTMADMKIAIVDGQEFSVPASIDDEALRNQLAATFPSVATASINKGTRRIDGVDYDTREFVKKAGTKGSDLADALASVPPAQLVTGPRVPRQIHALLSGATTFGEAVSLESFDLQTAIADTSNVQDRAQGEALCHALDQLAPVAADVLPAGW
jgi:hypothetical protein